MKIEQVKIRVSDLTLGMFISKLDCPWSQTPFPLQGFLLKKPADINTVRTYCEEVYIDITKGLGPLGEDPVQAPKLTVPTAPLKTFIQPLGREKTEKLSTAAKPILVKKNVYTNVIPLNIEIKQAERAMRTLRGHLLLATKQIAKGREFDYPALKQSVEDMVSSVVRCPDAFTWLMKLRAKDQYSHDHSMRTALWSAQFGRFIGLSRDEISTLTLGALMKDIGKTQIPESILKSKKRTEDQEQQYRKFIQHGVELLKKGKVDVGVISVVRHHCERNDGSGFPQGIAGNKIPLLARIVGVATVYDRISSPRLGGDALSPSKAISALYSMRGKGFQDDLVVKFIQSVGLYPTGTLVEVTTGDIGVVVEQHPESRLTPQIAIVSDPVNPKKQGHGYFMIDLKDEAEAREKMIAQGFNRAGHVSKLAIARDLEFAGHNVDISAVSELFMDVVASKVEEAIEEPEKLGFFGKLKETLSRSSIR